MPIAGLMEMSLRQRGGNTVLVGVSPSYLDFGHFRVGIDFARVFVRFQMGVIAE